ncbi:MAG: hypothetical protein IKN14_06760 [Clostridiales bacterium]|nr:hypothetical protein [Clostridiales bacterium]
MTEEDEDDDYVPFGEADRYDSTSVDSSYQDQDYTGYYSSPAPEPPVSQPPVIVQVQEKKKQPMIDGI